MRWLADYTAIPEHITPREFAEAMTMSGSKVEGYAVEGSEIKNVVVGKILSIVPHPDSDHMVICKVDVGGPEIFRSSLAHRTSRSATSSRPPYTVRCCPAGIKSRPPSCAAN